MIRLTLTVKERLCIKRLLLPRGGIIEMDLVQAIRDKIKFTAAEVDEMELRDLSDGSIKWDVLKETEKEFDFEDSEMSLLQKGVRFHDEHETITEDTLATAKRLLSLKK